ncbi:MAG TPA: hypothetical protein VIY49_11685 [Bryobacteraceae bacterium]
MKRIAVVFATSLFLLPFEAAFAFKNAEIKLEVVAPSEDRSVKTRAPGLVGAIAGARTTDVVFMVNVLINGDHARLKCYENHRGCTAVGPGIYDAEIDEKNGDIWINIVIPVSHRIVRDHWRVAGTW